MESEIRVAPIDCSLHFTRSHFPAPPFAEKIGEAPHAVAISSIDAGRQFVFLFGCVHLAFIGSPPVADNFVALG